MPPLPKNKPTLRKATKVAPKAEPSPKVRSGDISRRELNEAITDLLLEFQQLNANIGKLYEALRPRGVEREIPDDDVPF